MPDGDIDVFISYKKEEAGKAQRLLEALEAAGYSAVYDATGLNLNDNFADKLESLIRRARRVVVLWTELSCKSDWVRDEARLARDLDKYLGVVVEPKTDIALDLRNLHKVDITRVEFNDGVDIIVKEVAEQLGPGSLTPKALAEASFYRAVKAGGTRGGYEAFLSAHPSGRYAEQARRNMAALPRRRTVPAVVAAVLALLMGAGGYFAAGYVGPSPPDATQVKELQDDLRAAITVLAAKEAELESLTQDVVALKQEARTVVELRKNAERLNAELALLTQKLNAALASRAAASIAAEKAKPNCSKGSEDGILVLSECHPLSTASLSLRDPLIVDATPLSGLTSLRRLFLEGTQIADASPLSGLTSLQRLALAGTRITNLAPLRNLTNLHYLRAPDGRIVGSPTDSPKNRRAVADYIAAHSR